MFLARLSAAYSTVVAVSGAHGKSSTTALIAHILTAADKSPTFLIGADLNGVGSFSPGKGWNIFVTEVDESDGTHVFVFPTLGVVPNIEEDHAWSVGGAATLMDNFASFGRHCRHLIYCSGENPDRLFADHPSAERLTDIAEEYLGFYGFQAANAQLAVAAAVYLGVPREQAETAARSFPGIGRRMQLRHRSDRLIVIEDYAHHPSEIAAALRLLRHQYPGHHLRVLIQPHRYARLEYFFDGFRRELAQADSVLIAPVFAAWTESGSVGSSDLAAALPNARCLDCGWEETAEIAVVPCPEDPRPLLLAVLGAGDISEVFQHLPR